MIAVPFLSPAEQSALGWEGVFDNVRKGQFTSQSRTQDMTSHERNFGELKIGAVFLYHGQTYEKESDKSAVLLRWANEEELLKERVSHRFFEEIVVQVSASENKKSSCTNGTGE